MSVDYCLFVCFIDTPYKFWLCGPYFLPHFLGWWPQSPCSVWSTCLCHVPSVCQHHSHDTQGVWSVVLLCPALGCVPLPDPSLCSAGAFGGFGTTTTTAASAFSFSAPTNTGTSGKGLQDWLPLEQIQECFGLHMAAVLFFSIIIYLFPQDSLVLPRTKALDLVPVLAQELELVWVVAWELG